MPVQIDALTFESSAVSMLLDAGWSVGDMGEWDAAQSLFPERVVEFARVSQPEVWAKLLAWHVDEDDLAKRIVSNVVKELDLVGTLEVLRNGFKYQSQRLYVACFRPAHQLSPGLVAQYEQNRLTVTRQVPVRSGAADRVGLLFALNGVPVATCETADPVSGSTWRDAVRLYRHERGPECSSVPVRPSDSCPFRCRCGRGGHDDTARRRGDTVLAVQSGQQPRRG